MKELEVHPEATFTTPEEAHVAITAFARGRGYAVIRMRPTKNKRGILRRVVFACDRHGVYKPKPSKPGAKKRAGQSTKKCNCPMRLDLVLQPATGLWRLEHRGAELMHNHEASDEPSSHVILRRTDRTPEVVASIVSEANNGATPAQTILSLRASAPGILIRKTDVYNTKRKEERREVGPNTRAQHLLDVLEKNGDFARYRLDEEGRVSHLFFAHAAVLDLIEKNWDILLMDCTYKTNKFGMPLLNIIGVSGMNTTLHVAHCFMRGENKDDYVWALNALRECLDSRSIAQPQVILVDRDLALLNALEEKFVNVPVLLCLWHVVKAVETHARLTFRKVIDQENSTPRNKKLKDSPQHRAFCDMFLETIRATSEEQYTDCKTRLREMSEEEADYIDETWLHVWERRIVRVWTNNVVHFGLQSTSRVEGYHRSLKRWLNSSEVDMLAIYKKLKNWWDLSIQEYKDAVSDTKMNARTLTIN